MLVTSACAFLNHFRVIASNWTGDRSDYGLLVLLDMSRIYPERPDSGDSDQSLAADILLRQQPDEEEEEEEDEDDRKEDEDDEDGDNRDSGYSE